MFLTLKKRGLMLLAALMTLVLIVGCAAPATTAPATTAPTPTATVEAHSGASVPTKDRAGNAIEVPETINAIISTAPSTTEVLIELGLGDKLVAVDSYSKDIPGVKADVLVLDSMAPDAEAILALKPDVLFATTMSMVDGVDVYKPIADAGVCMIYIPSSDSIEGIREDMAFVGAVTGTSELSDALIERFDSALAAVSELGKTIPQTDRKTVYFEVSAAPFMFSFGAGTFLNEMLEMIGATNIFADETGWMSVTDEVLLSKNPDVILTSVNYIDDPIGEIKARPGWDALKAVNDNAVYLIDTDSSNRPNHNILKALNEMGKAIYPDVFK